MKYVLPMTSSFAGDLSRLTFFSLCLITFLGSLSLSTLVLLSVLLNVEGHSAESIGIILSSPLAPTLIALFSAGGILKKISCIQLMTIGQGLVVLGFIGMEFNISSVLTATVLRSLIGFGAGLYFSASMIYARTLLTGKKTIYLFGIFASMMPLPNAFGPIIAEWYFQGYGLKYFFLYMALPALLAFIGLIALLRLGGAPVKTASINVKSYFQVLGSKKFQCLTFGIFAIGLLWGFVIAYISLYFSRHHLAVGLFFFPMSITLFCSRFGLLGILNNFSNNYLVACSFGLMAFAFILILNIHSPFSLIFSGLIFGLGYSLGFPILGVWVSDIFESDRRPIAMSLFNASFYSGIFGIPFLLGLLSIEPSSNYSFILLIILAVCMTLFFIFTSCHIRQEKRV